MKRLDRAGLDYLIDVAAGIGFVSTFVETREYEDSSPKLWIEFVQRRELQDKHEAKPEHPPEAPPTKSSNLRMLDGTEI